MILESMTVLLLQLAVTYQPQRTRDVEVTYAATVVQRVHPIVIEILNWTEPFEWLWYPDFIPTITDNANISKATRPPTYGKGP